MLEPALASWALLRPFTTPPPLGVTCALTSVLPPTSVCRFWIQCNTFEGHPDLALTAGGATTRAGLPVTGAVPSGGGRA